MIIIISALVIYILIKQPFGIKLFSKDETPNAETYDHPLLTNDQEKVLDSLGVDTATLQETLTQEQITCFEGKLGQARVAEIVAGSAITTTDYLKASGCI